MKKQTINFIKRIVVISLPIILQQLFLNLASLVDTLMVGQLDDTSVSGVYIATQIIFVVNLMIFGSVEGATVFFSQFYGKEDTEHMKNAYAFKFLFSVLVAGIATIILSVFGKSLIQLFLEDTIEIQIAHRYLKVVSYSLIPYAISVSISTTMREYHKAVLPMVITMIGIIANMIFNYLLIFGKFSFPAMGATGAAVGTLIERTLECVLIILVLLLKKYEFSKNFIKSFKIEKKLLKQFIRKSIPLFFNETLWGLSQTVLILFFTKCDPIATTSLPIAQTIFNLLFVVMIGLGNGVTILVGNTIGKNEMEESQHQAYISLLFTLLTSVLLGIILFLMAPFIVSLYSGISDDAKNMALFFIRFNSFYMVLTSINTTMFFLLRAGGRTEVVFFFDSFYGWILSIPLGLIILKFTHLDLKTYFCLIYSLDVVKTMIGFVLIAKRKWHKNLTINESKA